MSVVIDGSNGITFPSTSVQGDTGIGYGQTWTDVTASRAGNTLYTNSTTKPITVCIYPTAVNGVGFQIGGVTVASSGQSSANTWMPAWVVPAGQTYQLTFSTSVTIGRWVELR